MQSGSGADCGVTWVRHSSNTAISIMTGGVLVGSLSSAGETVLGRSIVGGSASGFTDMDK